ncbi:hypothetical protein, partial [Acinetobacter pseudolwoffii]|uniref:hypothetical protein n=1 Tax=Acinetobacter pseudolwoffii TaxID=2053287 RepID=UPI00398A4488
MPIILMSAGFLSDILLNFTHFPTFLFSAHKKTPPADAGGVSNNELAMTYSHMGNPTLPSA